MICYGKNNPNFIGAEEMMKSYYQYLILDKYKIKSKTKIDEELYEFTTFTEPAIIDIGRKENNITNFFMIKINGEWKFALGVNLLPASKIQEHEYLQKRLIARQVDAERNNITLY